MIGNVHRDPFLSNSGTEGPPLASITPAEHGPFLGIPSTSRALGLPWDDLAPPVLIEGHTQRLGSCGRRLLVRLFRASAAPFFDVVFACLHFAPWNNCDALGIQCGHHVFPLRHDLHPLVVDRFRLGIHVVMDGLEELLDRFFYVLERDGSLRTRIPPGRHGLVLSQVGGPNLQSDRNTLEGDAEMGFPK